MARHRRHQTSPLPNQAVSPQRVHQAETRDDPPITRGLYRGALGIHHFNAFMEPPDALRQFTRPDPQIEDRRFWHPAKARLSMPFPRQYHRQDGQVALQDRRIQLYRGVPGLLPHLRLQFREPKQTLVCIRRQARRQVLFALRRTGRGSGAAKRPRWTTESFIQCRRVR